MVAEFQKAAGSRATAAVDSIPAGGAVGANEPMGLLLAQRPGTLKSKAKRIIRQYPLVSHRRHRFCPPLVRARYRRSASRDELS